MDADVQGTYPENMAKKPEIKFAKGSLDAVPEEDRAELLKEIGEAFKNFDPNNPPGSRVEEIEDGVRACPRCGEPLSDLEMEMLTFPDGSQAKIVECEACNVSFSVQLKN